MQKNRETVKGLLSVIIPIYNIEPYLRKCLDSVLGQTYSNIEIIIVDDGSTDGSGKICDIYQQENKQISVYHVRHGGTARARNLGLCYARGEYLGFVDGDDSIDADMYESMLSEMEDDSIDIVTCGRYISYPAKKHTSPRLKYSSSKRMRVNNKEAMEELLKGVLFSFSVCDKAFRSKLFYNITFPEGRTCEDIPVAYQLFAKSRYVVHCGQPKYHNYHRDNSSSRCDFYYRRIDQALFAGEIYKNIKTDYPCLIKQAEALYIEYIVCVLRGIRVCHDRNKYRKIEKRLQSALRRMSIKILYNPYILPDKKWEYFCQMVNKKCPCI